MPAARKSAPARNNELAMIHIAAQQIGMDDSTYRDMLWTVARVRSAKDLDLAGREAVLGHLKACGWKDPRAGRSTVYRRGTQAALVRHLWSELAKVGRVQDGSDKALCAYVRQQSSTYDPKRAGWDHPNFLPRSVASKVIEHLKQWLERAAPGG